MTRPPILLAIGPDTVEVAANPIPNGRNIRPLAPTHRGE
jgi:hypothetical protein